MVLAYHGSGSDPWLSYSLPMIQLFGFNAYPTGVVGRRSGILDRNGWNNKVVIQSNTVQTGVTININNKQYNAGSRTITADVQLTSTTTLTGDYYVMFILTENNLVYPQTGNSSCTGYSNYIHDHVVKGLVNGATGTLLNTSDNWTSGTSVTVPLNYIIPAGVVEGNANMNIFVYRGGGNVAVDQEVQQSRIQSITQPVGISNTNEVADKFSLDQNYPNPFNPTTNIRFSIPTDQNVSLKFYNAMGQEVSTYVDDFLKAGVYNAEFDASNLSSGIYFYTLKTTNFVETKKMMLIK